MAFVESTISLILTLGILVTIHEYGHFWVARKCGVKVLRFSVGFGKPLYTWFDKSGTEFAIAAIPLGGYVKMLDEREAPVPPELKQYAFNLKPVKQRIAIVAAGPIANFIFAIFAYWLMFLTGFSALIPSIGGVEKGSIAYQAGLTEGYEIVSVDGRETPGWRAVNMELINRIGDTGTIRLDAVYKPISVETPFDTQSSISTQSSINNLSSSDKQSHFNNAANVQQRTDYFELKIENWMLGEEPHSLLRDLGIQPQRPVVKAVIDQVIPAGAAEQGGMLSGDEIVAIDGKLIGDWFDFVDVIQQSGEKQVMVKVLRLSDSQSPEELVLAMRPEIFIDDEGKSIGRLGVSVKPFQYPEDMIRNVQLGPLDSFISACGQTWADTKMTLNAIKKMIMGLISLDNLSGPITIAQVASESIKTGSEEFLRFLAMLSVSLGVLNLLPIPVLDGGHLFYYLIESVRGKPVPEKWQVVGLKIGVSFVLMLMALAIYNDLMRL